MKPFLISVTIMICASSLEAQVKDAAFHQRVDDRVSVMMEYFEANIMADTSIVDTVAYIQRIYAIHMETIKLRTNVEKNRQPMYEYAQWLRNQKLAKVISKEYLEKYYNSFETETSGFKFCSECGTKRQGDSKFCGNCGNTF